MSPEQVTGGELGPASDIFSLGVIMYEVVTGRRPFTGNNAFEIAARRLTEDPLAPRRIVPMLPTRWDAVIQKCLRREPRDRFANAAELVEALTGTDLELWRKVDQQIEICPFRGLEAFRPEDSRYFSGREMASARLLDAIQTRNFVAVVGPSGCGKSSLIHSGLLAQFGQPGLIVGQWLFASFTPVSRPFHRLAAAILSITNPELRGISVITEGQTLVDRMLSAPNSLESLFSLLCVGVDDIKIVLVIDQFEELFTMADAADRKAFIQTIVQACSAHLRIIVTLRADYYGHAIAVDRALSDLLEVATVNVGPMTYEEAERVITVPARAVGCEFEPGLVSRILKDIEQQPGYLPLLEFTLTELWERRQGGLLTHSAYQEVGGVAGSIANRGESLFQTFSDREKTSVRMLFSRLVRVAETGGEGNDARARVRRSDLSHIPWLLIETFAAQQFRLVVIARDTAEETVEIAHEALISNWSRLSKWIEQDRQFLLWRQKLDILLVAWEASQRDAGSRLRGNHLRDALDWWKRRRDDLNRREQEFIILSYKSVRTRSRFVRVGFLALALSIVVSALWLIYTRTADYQLKCIISDPICQRQPSEEVRFFGVYGRLLAGLVFCDNSQLAISRASANPAYVVVVAIALTQVDRFSVALQYVRSVLPPGSQYMALIGISETLRLDHSDISLQVLDQALIDARAVRETPKRVWALSTVANEFASMGRIELAKMSIAEARRSAESISSAKDAASALNELWTVQLHLAERRIVNSVSADIPDPLARFYVLVGAARFLLRSGRVTDILTLIDSALATAEELPEKSRVYALADLVSILAKVNDKQRVGRVAARLAFELSITPPEEEKRVLLNATARLAIKMGDFATLARALEGLADPREHVSALITTAIALNGFGEREHAGTILREAQDIATRIAPSGSPPSATDARCLALSTITNTYTKLGMLDSARQKITDVETCVRDVTNEATSSIIYSNLSSDFASLHQYRKARLVAEACRSEHDRVSAYATIVTEIGKQLHPDLLSKLEKGDSW